MYPRKKYKKTMALLISVCLLITMLTGFTNAESGTTQSTEDDYAVMSDRVRAYLIGSDLDLTNPIISSRIQSKAKNAKQFLDKINGAIDRNSIWDDIPVRTDNIHTATTYSRLNTMAEAYSTPGSDLYRNAVLRDAIITSMDWVYQNWYNENSANSTNGWYDNIGIPLEIVRLVALMYSDLTPAQLANFAKTIDKWVPDPARWWGDAGGANLYNQCWIVLLRGIYDKNPDKIRQAIKALDKEFTYAEPGDTFNSPNNFAPPESGFYTDGSFIQHWRFPYTGGYGLQVLQNMAVIIYVTDNTEFVIDNPDAKNLYNWIYDTYLPVMYNGQVMDIVRGREVGRTSTYLISVGTVHALLLVAQFAPPEDAAKIKAAVKYWLLLDTKQEFLRFAPLQAFELVEELMNDASVEPVENTSMHKQFPIMDRVVHHQPDYSFAIGMSSNRIYNYECINGENTTGWYQGDGVTYLYNENDLTQYLNYFTQVNSYRLPGTTVDTQTRQAVTIPTGTAYRSSKDWVGGTGIGNYGISGMWLDADKSTLEAKKSWFMFDDEIVALGAGINSTDNRTIETIVENRKLSKKNPDTVEDPNLPTPYKVISVTASADDGNIPINTLDENLNTRWSANGAGQWIQFELEGDKNIGYIAAAFYNGDKRATKFEVQVSNDGVIWQSVFTGQSSGKSADLEAFDLADATGSYLRIIGNGNTVNTWNSIAEAAIYAPNENGPIFRPIAPVGFEYLVVNGVSKPTNIGWKETMPEVSWAYLEGTGGYYFPTPVTLNGWREKRLVNFMNLYMDHGKNPVNATYSYVLLPNKSAGETSSYKDNPDIRIVRNDGVAQAVKEDKLNILGVNFWEAGTVEGIEASNPASVMLEESGNEFTLSVSDPTQKQDKVTIKILNRDINKVVGNSAAAAVEFVEDGVLVEFNVSASYGSAQTVRLAYVTPDVLVSDLMNEIEGMDFDHGIKNSLLSKLDNVLKSISKDHKDTAVNGLNAFIAEVEAQSDKKLTIEQANKFISEVNRIILQINTSTTI